MALTTRMFYEHAHMKPTTSNNQLWLRHIFMSKDDRSNPCFSQGPYYYVLSSDITPFGQLASVIIITEILLADMTSITATENTCMSTVKLEACKKIDGSLLNQFTSTLSYRHAIPFITLATPVVMSCWRHQWRHDGIHLRSRSTFAKQIRFLWK